MEVWRKMTETDKDRYYRWVQNNLEKRWKLGEEKYDLPNGFQGDPLDHAIEEAFDLLVYLFYQKRKQCVEQDDLTGMNIYGTKPESN